MKQIKTEWWEKISFVRDTTAFNETNRDKVVGANFICEGYYVVHIKKSFTYVFEYVIYHFSLAQNGNCEIIIFK